MHEVSQLFHRWLCPEWNVHTSNDIITLLVVVVSLPVLAANGKELLATFKSEGCKGTFTIFLSMSKSILHVCKVKLFIVQCYILLFLMFRLKHNLFKKFHRYAWIYCYTFSKNQCWPATLFTFVLANYEFEFDTPSLCACFRAKTEEHF